MEIDQITGHYEPGDMAGGTAVAVLVMDDGGADRFIAVLPTAAAALAYCKLTMANRNWRLWPCEVNVQFLHPLVDFDGATRKPKAS